MCSCSPLYSPGLLTSTSDPLASRCFSTSSLKARILESFLSGTGYSAPGRDGTSWVISRPSASHLTLPPSMTLTLSWPKRRNTQRAEEHTSELQSHSDLVCRLL